MIVHCLGKEVHAYRHKVQFIWQEETESKKSTELKEWKTF
jgi:hypothetical protein